MYHKGPILRDVLCVVCWQLLLVKQGVDTEIFAVSDLASVAELKEVSAPMLLIALQASIHSAKTAPEISHWQAGVT